MLPVCQLSFSTQPKPVSRKPVSVLCTKAECVSNAHTDSSFKMEYVSSNQLLVSKLSQPLEDATNARQVIKSKMVHVSETFKMLFVWPLNTRTLTVSVSMVMMQVAQSTLRLKVNANHANKATG